MPPSLSKWGWCLTVLSGTPFPTVYEGPQDRSKDHQDKKGTSSSIGSTQPAAHLTRADVATTPIAMSLMSFGKRSAVLVPLVNTQTCYSGDRQLSYSDNQYHILKNLTTYITKSKRPLLNPKLQSTSGDIPTGTEWIPGSTGPLSFAQ